jgi:hypothetical protein
MLAFVDESGDTGMKTAEGSSSVFLISVVLFEDHDEATALDTRIAKLRSELNLPTDFEFHFKECSHNRRVAFFEAVAQFDFFYLTFCLQKDRVYPGTFKYQDSFYKWVCGTLFENTKPYLDNAIIKIDKCGSQEFRKRLFSYLRERIKDPSSQGQYIKSMKAEDSRSNNLLQLADMVCGAVRRSVVGDKSKAEDYRNIIKHREMSVRVWPK